MDGVSIDIFTLAGIYYRRPNRHLVGFKSIGQGRILAP